ncbi:MAG: ATP-dependent Clp protease proteolytic subunit [Planctomyces sp.]|nr:ATP-dependent Clp protease proteolytic subunit [Planctomyces sp.]
MVNMDEKEKTQRTRSSPALQWHLSDENRSKVPWEIVLCGDLTDRQADLLDRLTEVPPRSRGILYFDSCGGSVYTGLALATLIRTRQLKVTAVVIGECSSAALLPFAACAPRFVTRQATLLFHPMRWQSEEDVRLEEATEWARHFKHLEGDLDQILVKLLPLELSALHRWTRPGRFVTGQEIADVGLATLFDPFDTGDPWTRIRSASKA